MVDATAAWAIALVVFARSFTGLKNLARYERKTVNAPTVIASGKDELRARHRTKAIQIGHDAETIGRKQRLDLRALSAAVTVARLTAASASCSSSCGRRP